MGFTLTEKKNFIVFGALLLIVGYVIFLVSPAVFPDPGMGFQVLRSMHSGSNFNVFNSPDQSDIAQNYDEFLTWWSPGQYLVPVLFQIITSLNLGKAIAVTVTICQGVGLFGFYQFFKKIGFPIQIVALSICFIVLQQAFFVPYIYYNGGEILLFAFEGWFLFGCVNLKSTNLYLISFIVFSGWLGFFCKSSFIWMYGAGLFCLWYRLFDKASNNFDWLRKGLWVALPAALSVSVIYLFYISKGQSPASSSNGLKLTLQTFGFPIASPILSGFSIDDFLHGLLFHTGNAILSATWSVIIVLIVAVITLIVVWLISRKITNNNYKLFLIVFYVTAILFFGFAYLGQLAISMEARHYRILGILITPGLIYLVAKLKKPYIYAFCLYPLFLLFFNLNYLINGIQFNKNISARGVTGIAQPNIDQQSLNYILKLDMENKNAIFVFVSDDIGLEIKNNRIITLNPIGDELKIDMDDYIYQGHAGPLFIVLPANYAGPKEKMILSSFPGYKRFNLTILSNNYSLYSAR